ncbi:hypothetical protein EVA_06206 [gut metagenome]|uniref:SecDF P1 head subdomain domain-containing protein n=1 Tax=gut metagenome TaxID=749906 RepID=J9CZI2_9ZZZZ
MGTLGCINDMLQRDKENRELRKRNRERMTDTRKRLLEIGKGTNYTNLSVEQLEDIRRKTLEKEKLDKAAYFKAMVYLAVGVVLILLIGWLLVGCNSRPSAIHRENGWYHVVSHSADSLAWEPIVTAKDFEILRLDTDAFGKQIIIGKIHPYYADRWAVETEKAIGKQIAFVFNDSVVSNPFVNARIESGNFAITSPCDKLLPAIYEKLNSEINRSYQDSLFKLITSQLRQEANAYQTTLTDTTFLKTKGMMSYAAIDVLNGSGFNRNAFYNQVVYLEALDRARRQLSIKNGQIVFPVQTGKELNMTEDLFLFIQSFFKDWNQWLKTGKYTLTKDEKGLYIVVPKPASKH